MNEDKAFAVIIAANGLFVILQIIFSYIANSTGLLADAIHNLGDVLSLCISGVANHLMRRAPTHRSTYGMKKTTILAAFASGILLVFTCGIIVSEAAYKLIFPAEMAPLTVMLIASIGIVINGSSALLLWHGKEDLNLRAAYLHLFYDAFISIGVVVSAAFIYWVGWLWLDPCVGIAIALIILKGTWTLFTDSFRLIIDGVPRGVSIRHVYSILSTYPNVKGVHDLHVWALSTRENALSVHLWVPDNMTDKAREQLVAQLRKECNIHHATIQIECSETHCVDGCLPFL